MTNYIYINLKISSPMHCRFNRRAPEADSGLKRNSNIYLNELYAIFRLLDFSKNQFCYVKKMCHDIYNRKRHGGGFSAGYAGGC